METVRVCKKCGVEKPIEAYYKHAISVGGRQTRCIQCIAERDKERRAEAQAGRPANWKKKSKDPEHRKAINKAWLAKHPGFAVQNQRRWYDRHKDRESVKGKFAYAVRVGKVKREPCFVCGDENAHGHHADYDHPLQVVWLCGPHHREVHRMVKNLVALPHSSFEEPR